MKKKVIISLAVIAVAAAGITGYAAARKPSDLHTAQEEKNAAAVTATAKADTATLTYIGEDAALAKALTHAKLDKADIILESNILEKDDGIWEYDIEFYSKSKEYDYKVNALDGSVISFSSEATASAPTTAATAPAGLISADSALGKALGHAGLTEDSIKLIKNVLDDDGKYEIEFHSGGKEYDYEVNSKTGAVLSCDIEIIRTTPAATQGSTNGNSNGHHANGNYIGTTAALNAALKHAGLAKNNVTVIKNALDEGEYDIEFISNGKEYDYEINAKTGAVVSCEIELAKATEAAANYIGKDAALSKAFSHAGVSASSATAIKNSLDADDRAAKYEIEFKCNGYEYEYEINASTGAVISFDKERD